MKFSGIFLTLNSLKYLTKLSASSNNFKLLLILKSIIFTNMISFFCDRIYAYIFKA